jgi:hypothetical protein
MQMLYLITCNFLSGKLSLHRDITDVTAPEGIAQVERTLPVLYVL